QDLKLTNNVHSVYTRNAQNAYTVAWRFCLVRVSGEPYYVPSIRYYLFSAGCETPLVRLRAVVEIKTDWHLLVKHVIHNIRHLTILQLTVLKMMCWPLSLRQIVISSLD